MMINYINPDRIIAESRDENEYCEAGTQGCCINHAQDTGSCEGW